MSAKQSDDAGSRYCMIAYLISFGRPDYLIYRRSSALKHLLRQFLRRSELKEANCAQVRSEYCVLKSGAFQYTMEFSTMRNVKDLVEMR